METLCQDIYSLIFDNNMFDIINLSLTCKYIYNIYLLEKKKYTHEGKYILSSCQLNLISEMTHYTHFFNIKPLILQTQPSVGKTAATITFAYSKSKEPVVIYVPTHLISQWYQEIINMYGCIPNNILILHKQYTSDDILKNYKCYIYNPRLRGYKIVIACYNDKYPLLYDELNNHLTIVDEIQYIKNLQERRLIGLTSSQIYYNNIHFYYKALSHKELLPNVIYHPVLCSYNINDHINDIKKLSTGPYMIVINKKLNNMIDDFIYDYSDIVEGLNLHVNCLIFIYPNTQESMNRFIKCVKRVNNKHRHIHVYHVHQYIEDYIFNKEMIDINDIYIACNKYNIQMVKYNKDIIKFISRLIKMTNDKLVLSIPTIYFHILSRIVKKDYPVVLELFSNYLNVSVYRIMDVIV